MTKLIAWLDQEDRRTTDVIRSDGVFVQHVGGDATCQETSFSYTVGLFGMGHPELLVLGASLATVHAVLRDIAGRVRRGHDLIPGEARSFEHWPHRVIPEVVPNPGGDRPGGQSFLSASG